MTSVVPLTDDSTSTPPATAANTPRNSSRSTITHLAHQCKQLHHEHVTRSSRAATATSSQEQRTVREPVPSASESLNSQAAMTSSKNQNEEAVDSDSTKCAESASPPPPPQRKSRILSRKTDHSLIERRRREKINERLIRLQECIPACREEVYEILETKPPKAARGKNVSKEVKKREIERCLKEELVLEKLCVISHSVDYIHELQAQVAAYRKLCQCDPPVGAVAEPRDPSLHVQYAHEDMRSVKPSAEAMADSSTTEQQGSISPVATTTAASITGGPSVKRKRHWGSNRAPSSTNTIKRQKNEVPSAEAPSTARLASPSLPHSPDSLSDSETSDDETEEEEALTEPDVSADDPADNEVSPSQSFKSRRGSDPTTSTSTNSLMGCVSTLTRPSHYLPPRYRHQVFPPSSLLQPYHLATQRPLITTTTLGHSKCSGSGSGNSNSNSRNDGNGNGNRNCSSTRGGHLKKVSSILNLDQQDHLRSNTGRF